MWNKIKIIWENDKDLKDIILREKNDEKESDEKVEFVEIIRVVQGIN